MALPVRFSHRPQFWSGPGGTGGNNGQIVINCFADREKTVPVNLAHYGPNWSAQVRRDRPADVVSTLTCDTSRLEHGQLSLTMFRDEVARLRRGYFVYDVVVTGGAQSPLTVFFGGFLISDDEREPS